MKVEFNNLYKQNERVAKEFLTRAAHIIHDSTFIDGSITRQLEEEFAAFCGVKYACFCNSGTAALHLALRAFGIESKHVYTAPNSFFATFEALDYCDNGAIFLDVDDTCNIQIGGRRGDFLPVSLYGNPCDLITIRKVSTSPLVHDACQAHGAKINGVPIAQLADATCYSFYPGKNLGAFGEAGAVVTDDKSAYEEMLSLKNHGQKSKYNHVKVGYNYRLNELQALSILLKLPFLEEDNYGRVLAAKRYGENLKEIQRQKIPEGNSSVYHIYSVFVDEPEKKAEALLAMGISTGRHYPKLINPEPQKTPKAHKLCRRQLSLPIHPFISYDEVDYVSEKLLSLL